MRPFLKQPVLLMAVLILAIGLSATAQTAPPPAKVTAVEAKQASTPPPPPSSAEPWSEDWIKSIKEPVAWFKWGADLRLRDEYTNNLKKYTADGVTLNKNSPYNETNYGRYRTRAWATVMPVPDVELNARATWKFRTYCRPDILDLRDTNLDEVIWDNLNVKWKNVMGQPLTLTVGRQDLMFGDGWLVLDGTPLDGARTTFFDAIRGTYEIKDIQTTVDAVYIDQQADSDWLVEPYNDQERRLMEQDERGAILWLTNKSLDKTEINAYYIYKNDMKTRDHTGTPADIHTYGARVNKEFDKNWRARAEIAQQLGHKDYTDICAMGFNSRLSYFVNDELNNNFRLNYEYLSGDRPGTETNEQFDPLWGRWPQFSEALALLGSEARPGETTNMHRVGPGWSISPIKDMEVLTDYHLLFCDQNTKAGTAGFSDSGCFRGQLLTTVLKYTFNPHMKGHLWGEYFFPGDYYTDLKNDVGMFLRAELVFTW
jgi:hypothetical protein